MSEVLDGLSFNKNYKVLKETADWLSQQKEPDIDQLVPRVNTAMQAYKVCKTRLDTVQATLSQSFESDAAAGEEPPSNGHAKSIAPRRSSAPTEKDGHDIPF